MSNILYFQGTGKTAEEAVANAFSGCCDWLIKRPSLIVELIDIIENAKHIEAHIRIMAPADSSETGRKKTTRSLDLKPKDPEHAKSGDPNRWRPIGMDQDDAYDPHRLFGRAVLAGDLPDVPLQDFDQITENTANLSPEEIRAIQHDLLHQKEEARKHLDPDATGSLSPDCDPLSPFEKAAIQTEKQPPDLKDYNTVTQILRAPLNPALKHLTISLEKVSPRLKNIIHKNAPDLKYE